MNNSYLNKQTNINIMHIRIVNRTIYDDLGKPMKQTSFTVKKTWGETFSKSYPL